MSGKREWIVGIDFSEKVTQLAYYDRGEDKPVSVSQKAGAKDYEIPTVLCRRATDYCFLVGHEAEYFLAEKGATPVEDLFSVSESEEEILVGQTRLSPGKLLAEFFQGVLKFLGRPDILKELRCLVITMPHLSPVQVKNLTEAMEQLGLLREEYFLQDYDQSFYYYAMTQRRENWNRNIGWYAFGEGQVFFQKLSVQNAGTPVVVRLRQAGNLALPVDPLKCDLAFCDFVKETLGEDLYSMILLTGEGFSQDWAKSSTEELCQRQRKVYFGNNLFVKGAVAGGKEKLENNKLKGYRFLCDSMVLVNVGMEMRIMGANAYYPLIEAGKNWYEYQPSCEFLLDGVQELVFVVSHPGESDKQRAVMDLPGLPKRPRGTTRLSLHMAYTSPEECQVVVKDMGFGEMFPSSGKTWEETIKW